MLTPLAFDAGHPFPFVSSLSLNLGFFVSGVRGSGRRFVRVKLPEPLRRFVPLGSGERLVLLEEVVAAEAERLFPGATVEETALFRVLRGSRGDESPVVRLEVADGASRELLAMLQTQLAAPDDAVCPVRGLLKLDDLAALAGELRRRSSRAA